MPRRIEYDRVAPGAMQAMRGLERYVRACGLEHDLLELVKLRASYLNGCAYCVDMHSKDARAAGESEQRIYAVPVWRETPFFTERERAALAWTEAVTEVGRSGAKHEQQSIGKRIPPGSACTQNPGRQRSLAPARVAEKHAPAARLDVFGEGLRHGHLPGIHSEDGECGLPHAQAGRPQPPCRDQGRRAAERAKDGLICAAEELNQLLSRSARHARELIEWSDRFARGLACILLLAHPTLLLFFGYIESYPLLQLLAGLGGARRREIHALVLHPSASGAVQNPLPNDRRQRSAHLPAGGVVVSVGAGPPRVSITYQTERATL